MGDREDLENISEEYATWLRAKTASQWPPKQPKPERKLPELTPAWFQVAMAPRHQPDGSILRTLTPPRRGSRIAPPVILLGIAILSAIGFIFGMK